MAKVLASGERKLSNVADSIQPRVWVNKSVNGVAETGNVRVPLDAAQAWLRNSSPADTFQFVGVAGCFSTMEVHRNGQPVTLTDLKPEEGDLTGRATE